MTFLMFVNGIFQLKEQLLRSYFELMTHSLA